VQAKLVTFHKEIVPAMRYFEVSTKSCYHFEMPFLSLARQLSGDPNLAFTMVPVLLQPWHEVPLPDDDHEEFWA
jgi:GTP-binding nuclear protein Ran